MHRSWLAALAVSIVVPFAPAKAEEAMTGTFTAREACAALQSIRKQTNPGNVKLVPEQSYKLLAGNKPQPTFYRVQVEDAQPAQRWVPVSCGEVKTTDGAAVVVPGAGKPGPAPSPGGASYVFAISWQAAFCEGLPDKTECRTQTADRYDASHFTLHGLWPQPRGNAYCGVARRDVEADKAHRWEDLPEPQLEPATRTALEKAMPGTASFLDRHEWIEHGTCFFEKSADAYFRRSVALIGEINASPVQKLFADNVGKQIDTSEIRSAFDQGFGTGAGERVRFACKRDGSRSIIVEMTIGLRGEVKDGARLADLIAAASPTDQGCKAGVVDPVGLQ
ncbi:ribonuclease T2 [Labrys sp. KNU-23]|uniref:ribonuclease T2 family protein n=1 Tax=Labrys sp. KNU-23 TaxID=2789216 RepID=UPI0011EF5247|nr:ribonuclease T2 [Labrys sp. KNU-23]QEN87373.1 ribonuclease T2 [Labrys sp. KNU-23]